MKNGDDDAQGSPVVRVSDLEKVYGTAEGEVTALDSVSLSIDAGTVVGILGPNGAGKTTLIKSILDLVRPTSGTVEVFGTDVRDAGRDLYTDVSAMLEGARNIYWRLSLRENLYYFTSLQGIDPSSVADENRALVETLGLEDVLDDPVNTFSRGMKQKATLACTLARRTDLLFLDEPTLGLDVDASRDLRNTLRTMVDRDDRTVVLSSHDMDVIEELCDRVVVLNEGSIVADDAVSSLLDAFRTQRYRFTLDGDPGPDARQAIADTVGSCSWTTDGSQVDFEATLEDPRQIYELVPRLERAGVLIHDVETLDPDLEEVFLRVTGHSAEPPTADHANASHEQEVS